MPWWWPLLEVETGCHLITTRKRVRSVGVTISTYVLKTVDISAPPPPKKKKNLSLLFSHDTSISPPILSFLYTIPQILCNSKFHPIAGHEGPERDKKYSSTHSYARCLIRVGRQRFTSGKETRYPSYKRLGGSRGQSGRKRKISSPRGFEPRTVEPAASRYSD